MGNKLVVHQDGGCVQKWSSLDQRYSVHQRGRMHDRSRVQDRSSVMDNRSMHGLDNRHDRSRMDNSDRCLDNWNRMDNRAAVMDHGAVADHRSVADGRYDSCRSVGQDGREKYLYTHKSYVRNTSERERCFKQTYEFEHVCWIGADGTVT